MGDLSSSAKKIQQALQALGLSLQVVEMPASTRTANDAAAAAGCQVGQIVKSLVFKKLNSGTALLITASGANRVSESLIAEIINEPIGKADAEFVRLQTGFVIGGVPPIGHTQPIETLIDQDLFQFTDIWAAAGTPNAIFRLTPADLQRMTGGKVVKITA